MWLVIFFALNALFWGLASHSKHCAIVPGSKCLPHWAHIGIGFACFALAVFFAQRGYIEYLLGVSKK